MVLLLIVTLAPASGREPALTSRRTVAVGACENDSRAEGGPRAKLLPWLLYHSHAREGVMVRNAVWRTSDQTLESVERCHIEGVLRQCHWRLNWCCNAAECLGLHP